ncbi:MAG: hypothetical protein C0423_19540 [Methylibium sp.]|nr:hypothetical protein [Methylibium sp.]
MSLPSSAQPGADDGLASAQRRALSHAPIAETLAAATTEQLAAQIESRLSASAGKAGIGAGSVLIEFGGQPVFVKLLPLSDLELRQVSQQSTANLFELPGYFQYGIGSVGFGAWRELAAQQMASDWVRLQACPQFPLLHHWRVLPGLGGVLRSNEADGYFAEGSLELPGVEQVNRRFASLDDAPAHLALFIEWFPSNLRDWLHTELRHGGQRAKLGVELVECELDRVLRFMSAQGFVHFDAHFENMLTDGHGLYLSDFGLASCSRFELDADERQFLAEHADYDRCRSSLALVLCIVKALGGGTDWRASLSDPEFLARVDACSGSVLEVLQRHAPLALAFAEFSRRLVNVSKTSAFPAAELKALLPALSG